MYKLMNELKNVVKWGNSGGVLVPREWIGKQIKLTLVDRTSEIKKEIFKILDTYLEDIVGIYLVGSYARNEQNKQSDIDVIVISTTTKKEIFSGKYHIFISPLTNIKKTLEKNPILIYPRLIEAKTIVNNSLLKELISKKISKKLFTNFITETKRIIKINTEIIELDKLDGEYLESTSVIYSAILRLRGIFLIKSLLTGKRYSNKNFKKYVLQNIPKLDFEKTYNIYRLIKEKKKVSEKIKIVDAEKLIDLLKKEVNKW